MVVFLIVLKMYAQFPHVFFIFLIPQFEGINLITNSLQLNQIWTAFETTMFQYLFALIVAYICTLIAIVKFSLKFSMH